MSKIPEFYIEGENASSIHNTNEFHNRIIELIEINLNGKSTETTLCHLITEDGTVMTADLPKHAYKQSILKSLEFYVEHENYEMCTKIKNLIEKL
jgi:hypothetical protein